MGLEDGLSPSVIFVSRTTSPVCPLARVHLLAVQERTGSPTTVIDGEELITVIWDRAGLPGLVRLMRKADVVITTASR